MWPFTKKKDVIDLSGFKTKSRTAVDINSPANPSSVENDSLGFLGAMAGTASTNDVSSSTEDADIKIKTDDIAFKLDSLSRRVSSLIDRIDLLEKKVDRNNRLG